LTEILVILVISFTLMLAMNVPIAVAIAMSTFLAILAAGGDPAYAVAMKMANGVDSFALLAIPFFIFSGVLMGRGGMASRLIRFANALVGWFPGGLAYVNTLTCMLFGAISGSAVATVSSIGGFMIPEMNRNGYNREFNVAVTVTAATTGMVIPPSNIMIVYAVAAGSVSIAAMFIAGVLPGILIGLCILAVCALIGLRRGYKAGEFVKGREVMTSFMGAFLSLLLIVIVIGGILGGIFTATEAAAIAVAYSFLLSVVVYREVKITQMPEILLQVGKITAIVMLMVGASSAMSWVLTTQNIPQTVSRVMLGISDNPMVIMLIINVLLLVVGTFMDMTPAVLIFTPIFLPVVEKLGMHPVHFGIMIIANLCIGLCTPPVGACLFVGCSVGKTSIAEVTRPMLPFFFAMAVALMVITYVPQLSLWLPGFFELIK
jgi:tripartite ATP-independent transporter DctM subunit